MLNSVSFVPRLSDRSPDLRQAFFTQGISQARALRASSVFSFNMRGSIGVTVRVSRLRGQRVMWPFTALAILLCTGSEDVPTSPLSISVFSHWTYLLRRFRTRSTHVPFSSCLAVFQST